MFCVDDMLTFISKRTKTVDGLSVKDVITACQLTKSKFYRCAAEPFRFTDAQLDTIANLLHLNEGDKRLLFQYKHETRSEKRPEFYDYLKNIILGEYAFEDDRSTKPFILYTQSDKQGGMGIYHADSLASWFCEELADFSSEKGKHPFEITIFNTYEAEKVKIIYTLLNSILKLENVKQNHDVSANHFVNSSSLSVDKQFFAFYNLYSLIGMGAYDIHFANMDDVILGAANAALLKYVNRKNQDAYVLFHISKGSTSVYTFEDSNFANFLVSNFAELDNIRNAKRLRVADPIVANTVLREASEQYKKAMVSFELCLENLLLDIWDETNLYLQSNPEQINVLRAHADPENKLIGYGDRQFVEVLFNGFIARGRLNEQNEAISVIAATGLRDFAKEGSTTETRETGIELTVEQRIRQLKFIKSRLGSAAKSKQQSFYLIDPMFSIPKRCFMIFKDYRIAMSFQESSHIDYTWKTLSEELMATLFYEYVDKELLSSENREQFGSIVMSDSRASVYIDDLISKLCSGTPII